MEVIFNEVSFQNIAASPEEANKWMDDFFNSLKTLEKRLHKTVYTSSVSAFSGQFIANNYVFSQWLSNIKDREWLRKIIAITTHLPFRHPEGIYQFNGLAVYGLGLAFEEDKLTCSYPVTEWNASITFSSEIIDAADVVVQTPCAVKNIVSSNSVFEHFPAFVFEHHEKHDSKRHNLNDGESTLYYNIPNDQETVQKLLDCSFSENGEEEERRYVYDENQKKYVEFNCHQGLKYHGYHIEDANRVPHTVKLKIHNFKDL
ncbi:hypothetical protein ESA94_09355 [Lacibacter luteus]|uniref:Uncharacterized protein n=1 Tax=Lacibacter luteus TaxID=2508719 RepID=A0A4Q1CJ40_9BACT|nr:hypothetical protein [Lacibacter luteus]RXK60660.1 hypothetical protein ESA94_09355 [Lacibacter luteus]